MAGEGGYGQVGSAGLAGGKMMAFLATVGNTIKMVHFLKKDGTILDAQDHSKSKLFNTVTGK